jgi:hypothetical protein
MQTYKIIGADQKEYGPVTGDQIRQWIADGRVNGQTPARAEGAQEWMPLSGFPEFAEAVGAGGAPGLPASFASGGSREAALQAVKGPALALKITAIIGLVLVVLGLAVNILTLTGTDFGLRQLGDAQFQKMFNNLSGGLGIIQNIIGAAVGVLVLLGATKMGALQNHSFALTISILAMLPCISPCCLLGLPFGIWALVVLNKPEVKSQFG